MRGLTIPRSLRSEAFTLFDLLTALAIFSILAAIAIPNWAAQLPGYRLNSASRQVQSELNRLRSQAVAQNTDFRLVFLNSSSYKIERKVGTSYQATGEIKPLPDGITISKTSGTLLSFTPRGTSNGETVRLCSDKQAGKNVVVSSNTGRVRIRDGAC